MASSGPLAHFRLSCSLTFSLCRFKFQSCLVYIDISSRYVSTCHLRIYKKSKTKLFRDLKKILSAKSKFYSVMEDKGRPLPKFGEWDVNDPASAEGFTVIFNKARNEKRTGGKSDSPPKDDSTYKHGETLGKPHSKKWFCCMQSTSAES